MKKRLRFREHSVDCRACCSRTFFVKKNRPRMAIASVVTIAVCWLDVEGILPSPGLQAHVCVGLGTGSVWERGVTRPQREKSRVCACTGVQIRDSACPSLLFLPLQAAAAATQHLLLLEQRATGDQPLHSSSSCVVMKEILSGSEGFDGEAESGVDVAVEGLDGGSVKKGDAAAQRGGEAANAHDTDDDTLRNGGPTAPRLHEAAAAAAALEPPAEAEASPGLDAAAAAAAGISATANDAADPSAVGPAAAPGDGDAAAARQQDLAMAAAAASAAATARAMVPDMEDDGAQQPKRVNLQNYASRDSGAVLLEASPASKGMQNLLLDSKDKYAISPCEDKQWAVLGLSEDILVRSLVIGSHEKYSSLLKEFQVRLPAAAGLWKREAGRQARIHASYMRLAGGVTLVTHHAVSVL